MNAKSCAKCAGPLPIQTGRGRRRQMCESCSPTRKRGKSPKGAPVAVLAVTREGLLTAVRAELDAAGVAAGHAGQAALLLAERIETGEHDSGSAVAQMVRQLHDSMARALVTQEPAAADPVEMFRGRLRGI